MPNRGRQRNPRRDTRNPRGSSRAGAGSGASSDPLLLSGARGFWDFRGGTAVSPTPNTAPGFTNGAMHYAQAWTNGTINGVTCVVANSALSNCRLFTGANDSPMQGQGRPCWFMIAQVQVQDHVIMDIGGGGERPHCYNLSGSGQWTMRNGIAVNVGARDTNPHVLCFLFNGASSKFFKDGVLISTVDAGVSTVTGGTEMALHNVAGGGIGVTPGSKYGMAMIGTGTPSDAEVIAAQVAWKAIWGIA